jgi:hypothetical protein
MERCVTSDETQAIIEDGIEAIYRGFYRLRKSEQYQREYDMMTTLINMLMEDREYLRKYYKVEAIEL